MTRKDKYSFVIDVRKYMNKESHQPLKRYSVRLCLQLFVGGIICYLRYLSLLVYGVCLRIVVSNTYYVVFLFCFSSSCCQFLWIVLF